MKTEFGKPTPRCLGASPAAGTPVAIAIAIMLGLAAAVSPGAVAAVVAGATMLLLLSKPVVLLLAMLATLPWIPLWMNSWSLFGMSWGPLRVNAPLIFLCMFAMLAIQRIAATWRTTLKLERLDLAIIAILAFALVSLTKAHGDKPIRSFYLFATPLLYYLAMRLIRVDQRSLRTLIGVITISGVLLAVWLVIECAARYNPFLPPIELYGVTYMYEYINVAGRWLVYQPGGAMADPTAAGLYLSMVLALFLCWSKKRSASRGPLVLSVFLILTCGIAVTQSRVVWAGYLCICLMQIKREHRAAWCVALTSLLIFSILVLIWMLPEASWLKYRLLNATTAHDRLLQLREFWRIFWSSPIFGIGYENFRTVSTMHGPTHNIITSILVEFGLVGFGIMLWIIYELAKLLAHEWKNNAGRYVEAVTMLSVLYLIAGMGHSVTLAYHPSALLWTVIGVFVNNRMSLREASESTPCK